MDERARADQVLLGYWPIQDCYSLGGRSDRHPILAHLCGPANQVPHRTRADVLALFDGAIHALRQAAV
jgi:hypothetical protein